MSNTLPVGAMPRQTKRTTVRNYAADLRLAEALFDERTAFLYSGCDPEIQDQTTKAINDALNNEWERDITIERWVDRAKSSLGLK
jgi:hypothetical protein